jgi:hypothetical protein
MSTGVIIAVRYRKYSSRDIPTTLSLPANSAAATTWKRYSRFLHLPLRTVVAPPELPVAEGKNVAILHLVRPEEGAEKTESVIAFTSQNSKPHSFFLICNSRGIWISFFDTEGAHAVMRAYAANGGGRAALKVTPTSLNL